MAHLPLTTTGIIVIPEVLQTVAILIIQAVTIRTFTYAFICLESTL